MSKIETRCFTLFDNWAKRFGANFTIALSGGGDSLALTALLQKWRLINEPNAILKACIIDHGIAVNSNEIARDALNRANSIGVCSEIIRLDEKIETRIQERARVLRFEKIHDFAARHKSRIILLGHNCDDQIETIVFRMCRKTGIDGLSGMAQLQNIYSKSFGSFVLGRPLLDFSRFELRQYNETNGIQYFDDPANISHKFARVRIRNFFEQNADIDKESILRIGLQASRLRYEFNSIIRGFLLKNLEFQEPLLELRNLDCLPQELQFRVLETIIQAFNYQDYRTSREKIENLIASQFLKPRTLAGVLISKKANRIVFKIAPSRKSLKPNQIFPNQMIFDAISNYCS